MACTVEQFLDFLKKEEKSEATISKYAYELQMFLQFLGKREIGKELMIQYRTYLSSRYRPQTVNGKLSAVNAFLKFTGLYEYRVKFLKVQRRAYIDETRELTQKEYERLMETAGRQGKYQLYYLMMTICSTGIRVSELRYVTVEAVMRGKAEIFMKGKYRIVIFPKNLAAQPVEGFCQEERHTKRQLVLYQERTTSGQKQYLPCHEKALRKGRSKKG